MKKYSDIVKEQQLKYDIDFDSMYVDFLEFVNEQNIKYRLNPSDHLYNNKTDRFGFMRGDVTSTDVINICKNIMNIAISTISKNYKDILEFEYNHISIIIKLGKFCYKLVIAPNYDKCQEKYLVAKVVTVITLRNKKFRLINPDHSEIIFKSDKQYNFNNTFQTSTISRIETSIEEYLDDTERYVPDEDKNGKVYKTIDF